MEVGKREIATYRYTITTRMIPALRWAAMRASFNVSVGSDGQSHKTVSTNNNLSEEKGVPKRYWTEVPPLTSIMPLLGQTGSCKVTVKTLPLFTVSLTIDGKVTGVVFEKESCLFASFFHCFRLSVTCTTFFVRDRVCVCGCVCACMYDMTTLLNCVVVWSGWFYTMGVSNLFLWLV